MRCFNKRILINFQIMLQYVKYIIILIIFKKKSNKNPLLLIIIILFKSLINSIIDISKNEKF